MAIPGLSGEDVSFEIHLELPGVDKRWMQVRYCPYRDRDDAVAGVVSHAVDITDRKRAGFDFADKSTELENILNALPDAIVYADAERRIRKVNPAFVRLFGYEPDEVLGQTTRFIYTSDEAYAEQGRLRYNVDARDMTEPYEIDYRRKDGSTFVSETVGTPVLNARGKAVGLMALIRDITGRKDTERRLAELRHLMDYVIQHHGAIDIESAPGRGTAIRVYLPLIEGESEPVEEGREIVAARREARILVVDDESLFRDLAVDMLHSVGYSVLTAEDGQAGLDFYREHWRAIDLVILDMIMPRLSGADTWRGMKAINPNVRALLASGYSREGEAPRDPYAMDRRPDYPWRFEKVPTLLSQNPVP